MKNAFDVHLASLGPAELRRIGKDISAALAEVEGFQDGKQKPIYCVACDRDLVNPHQSNAQRRRAGYKKGYHMGHKAALLDVLEDVREEEMKLWDIDMTRGDMKVVLACQSIHAKIKARLNE